MVSMSERGIRWSHVAIFTLVLLASIVSLAISASLVAHYNGEGYPPVHTGAYRDRIRILLVAGVWTTAIALILLPGFFFLGHHVAFGLLAHLVPVTIAFILFIIGSASLTALTRPIDCGNSGDSFERCSIVKGLVIVSWIDTIFVFIALVFLIVLAFVARSGFGVRKSTLYAD